MIPRWSLAGGGQSGLPASIAALPVCRAMVSVGPPLLVSPPSLEVALGLSPVAMNPQSLPLSRLYPPEVTEPEQLAPTDPEFPATMVSRAVKARPAAFKIPPPV